MRKQTAAASFAARAAGYGIAGELVDGNDLFAMHDACTRAVARARAGEGPTLIEARTYRMGPHNTSDDPTRYVDPVELEERRAVDPIARVRRYLTARGPASTRPSERALVDELRGGGRRRLRRGRGEPRRPGPRRSSTTSTPSRPARLRRPARAPPTRGRPR